MVRHFRLSFTMDVSSTVFLVLVALSSAATAQCEGAARELIAWPGHNGTISSPNYPRPYRPSSTCSWLLQTYYPGDVIKLYLTSLSLELEYSCNYDRLEIFDGVSKLSPQLARLCGSLSDRTFYSSGTSAYVTFTSDDSQQLKGFVLTYTAVAGKPTGLATTQTAAPRTTPAVTSPELRWNTTAPWSQTNGFTPDCISSDQGGSTHTAQYMSTNTIQFSSYLGHYPNDANCAWNLQADPGYLIHVHVMSMDLETSITGCRFDAVTLYDASWESSSRRLVTLCSTTSTSDYYSTGSSMYITFKSDSFITSTGFWLTYEAVQAPVVPEQPRSHPSEAPVIVGTIVGVGVGAVAIAVIVAFVILLVSRWRRRAADRRYLLSTEANLQPTGQMFNGGEIMRGPRSIETVVEGPSAGFPSTYTNSLPPAYADLPSLTNISAAVRGPLLARGEGHQMSDRHSAVPKGALSGSDVAAHANLEKDGPLFLLSPPSYEEALLGMAQTSVPCAALSAPSYWSPATSSAVARPLLPTASAPHNP